MTKSTHLTEEALFEMATARLSHDDQCIVDTHLAECSFCCERYEQVKFARSTFLHVAEIGLTEAMGPSVSRTVRPRRAPEVHWVSISAIALGCICVATFFFYPRTVSTASAAQLLSSAMLYENSGGDSAAFRIQVSGQTCAGGRESEKVVSFEGSIRCSRALQQMQNTPWGHGNPLSARTYAMWRNSLRRHHDHVAKREASWEIKTITDEDVVRAASLELRASDYHTTRLTLDFEDKEEISISETTEPMPTISAPVVSGIDLKREQPTAQYIDNPGDFLEVQAWTTLHRLSADSGWEAIVLRDGSRVQVKALVNNEEQRQQLLKGFAANPAIELEIHLISDGTDARDILPNRATPVGDDPGLAEGWLEKQFPIVDDRMRFSNNALHLSQQILGRAFFIDKLRQRQAILKHCSCARDLSNLITTENQALSDLQGDLYHSLEPLIGPDSLPPSQPLTFAQARSLDVALEDLITASAGPDEAAFQTRIQQIRGVLVHSQELSAHM